MRALLRRHRSAAAFLAKMVLALAAWFALYDLWLHPAGTLDRAVAHNAAVLAAGLLDGLGLDVVLEGRVLGLPHHPAVHVADNCTGLAVMGLVIGFVVA
ncbi:MAG: archaeosortase/exosortase family protein [Rhodothermales bacterium]|nr:archaeosortase/exosortase family protein [Rhodothermales bacterium]